MTPWTTAWAPSRLLSPRDSPGENTEVGCHALLMVQVISSKKLSSKKAILQGFPESSAGKESICNAGDPSLILGVGKILWRRDRLPTPVFLGLPCDSAGKKSTCNAGDLGLIPGLGKSPGEGKGYPLQYSGLENPMDCVVHGVTKSQTQLNDFHLHFTPPKSVRNASCKHLLDSSRALFPVKSQSEFE